MCAREIAEANLSVTELWNKLRERVLEYKDKYFVWYSVGCDDCGVYPIRGARYQCKDCHERVGYDLCGTCHMQGLAGKGRFNQNHRPGMIL